MLEEESEGGMVIFHCDGNREKEQVWSKMLRIMGVAKATEGAQMAVEANIYVWGVDMSIYKVAETAVRSSALRGQVWRGLV